MNISFFKMVSFFAKFIPSEILSMPEILFCHAEILFCSYIGIMGRNKKQDFKFLTHNWYIRIPKFNSHQKLSKVSTQCS